MTIDSQLKPHAERGTMGPKPNERTAGRDRAFFLSMAFPQV